MNANQMSSLISEELNKTKEELETYKKALDKACQKLNEYFYCHTMWECENTDDFKKYSSCVECIKEHVIKESEKK